MKRITVGVLVALAVGLLLFAVQKATGIWVFTRALQATLAVGFVAAIL
jgi:hypothetical protein